MSKPEHGPEMLGDAPVEDRHRRLMNTIAHTLDEAFNGKLKGADRKVGFILMVFNFDEDQGRTNYISNADRASVVEMLKEQIKRFEGKV